jgi:hypothetical protein
LEGPRKGMEKQQCVCFRMGNVYWNLVRDKKKNSNNTIWFKMQILSFCIISKLVFIISYSIAAWDELPLEITSLLVILQEYFNFLYMNFHNPCES